MPPDPYRSALRINHHGYPDIVFVIRSRGNSTIHIGYSPERFIDILCIYTKGFTGGPATRLVAEAGTNEVPGCRLRNLPSPSGSATRSHRGRKASAEPGLGKNPQVEQVVRPNRRETSQSSGELECPSALPTAGQGRQSATGARLDCAWTAESPGIGPSMAKTPLRKRRPLLNGDRSDTGGTRCTCPEQCEASRAAPRHAASVAASSPGQR